MMFSGKGTKRSGITFSRYLLVHSLIIINECNVTIQTREPSERLALQSLAKLLSLCNRSCVVFANKWIGLVVQLLEFVHPHFSNSVGVPVVDMGMRSKRQLK
jgi:hypothetical protein